MSKKREIISQISLYTVAEQITQGIAILAGILTRNFLGPVQMGMWATLGLCLEYAGYSTLGTTNATAREIPYLMGRRDERTATEIKNLVSTFSILTSALVALGFLLFALVRQGRLSDYMFWGMITIAILVVLQRFNNLMVALLRAYKRFDVASHQMVVSAIANVILIALLAFPFKIYGYMAAMVLSLAFNILYMAGRHSFNFQFVLSRKIGGLIAFGLPLMLLGFSSAIFKSVDKIVIIRVLGYEQMGLYSVAVMASTFLNRLPNAIGIILIPHFQEKFGVRDNPQDLKHYVDHAIYGFYTLMPLLIGLAWIAAPFMVSWLMPKFIGGIHALKYLILGSFFFAVSMPYGDLIITLKKHWWLLPITGFSILLSFLLNYLAIFMEWGIEGVAAMTTLTLFLYFVTLYFIAGSSLYEGPELFGKLKSILFRFLFMAMTLFVLDAISSSSASFFPALLFCLIFVVINAPFVIAFNKRFGLLSLMVRS